MISEGDMTMATLRLAADRPGGFISTSQLIVELGRIFPVQGRDAQIAKNRDDTYFSQKVRNMVSHRKSNFIGKGFAEYDGARGGIRITQKGLTLLRRI